MTSTEIVTRRVGENDSACELYIDGRMMFHSGIGRYLREVLARAPRSLARRSTIIYSSDEQLEWLRSSAGDFNFRRNTAAIYSLAEQLIPLSLPRGATYWVPHYNVPWFKRGPLIATVHDVAPLALPDIFKSRAKRAAAWYYFNGIKRRSDHVIAVSHFTLSELTSRDLVDLRRTSVVPNGAGAFWFEAGSQQRVKGRFLFVGNLKPHKNLERLVNAMERVRMTTGVELDVIGKIDGFRTGVDEQLLSRLRSLSWIRLRGALSDDELRTHYRQADALIFPSLYEGFGLPIIEAFAAGCCVLASNIGALVEVAGKSRSSGGVGEYFDPLDEEQIASSIVRHLELSEAEKDRMRVLGRKIADEFTWDRSAALTWKLLAKQCRHEE